MPITLYRRQKQILDFIKQYIDNPKCTVILFENPPYSDTSATDFIDEYGQVKTDRRNKFVTEEMKKDIETFKKLAKNSLCSAQG